MSIGEKLQELLTQYVVDTLIYIHIVINFCERDSLEEWICQMKIELETMKDIKQQADKNKFVHVKNSENKARAFKEYVEANVTADSTQKKLEKKLGAVLINTFEELQKLDHFLDAVEKLAVTSLSVFTDHSVLLNEGSLASVRSLITTARRASPLLIHFKRNNETFFLPILDNVEVLAFQLEKYICIAEQLCNTISEQDLWSAYNHGWMKDKPLEKFSLNINVSEKMLNHLNQLSKIRMDQHTRMAFILRKNALLFIGLFSKHCSSMQQFLSDLEESAVQLDRMKMGGSISTVAGSSVGIAGGVLSIVGIALAPVTVGVSLALTFAGLGLGVASGVNSLVTGITESVVNNYHYKRAQRVFQEFIRNVEKIQACLEQDCVNHVEDNDVTGGVIGDVPNLVNEGMAETAAKIGLQEAQNARNIPMLVTDLPDIGQVAKGTPLALTKSARAGFITLHALFIGIDIFFICKDGISLAKGSKSETSQLIRSRVTLWKSELDAWQKIYDSLCIGIWRYRKSQKMLEQPFYPYKKSIIMRIWEMFIYIKNKICLKLKKIKMCIKSLYLKLLDQLDQIF
ncbi:apolipoprotein L2-like [Paramisgurnus dabryanus]|uniref:apolipoprotein L2-like n=1 Tax=Paramisgurnus dabryanus TaxID=90735 RepID=UPI0031F398DB